MWYVYVLQSKENQHYVGCTEDLKRRMMEHLRGQTQTTRRMEGIELVYYEACRSKKDAFIREKQLKTGFGRGYIKRRLQHDLGACSSDG